MKTFTCGRGFTKIEFLAVVGLVVVLVGLAGHAFQAVRVATHNAFAWSGCDSIATLARARGLGILIYHEVYDQSFPNDGFDPDFGFPAFGEDQEDVFPNFYEDQEDVFPNFYEDQELMYLFDLWALGENSQENMRNPGDHSLAFDAKQARQPMDSYRRPAESEGAVFKASVGIRKSVSV